MYQKEERERRAMDTHFILLPYNVLYSWPGTHRVASQCVQSAFKPGGGPIGRIYILRENRSSSAVIIIRGPFGVCPVLCLPRRSLGHTQHTVSVSFSLGAPATTDRTNLGTTEQWARAPPPDTTENSSLDNGHLQCSSSSGGRHIRVAND